MELRSYINRHIYIGDSGEGLGLRVYTIHSISGMLRPYAADLLIA